MDFRKKLDLITGCKYVFQLEQGQTGYMHYQIYLCLHPKQRLSWLKSHIDRTAHWEPARHPEEAREYCSKTDTRVEGPWTNIRDVKGELDIRYNKPLRAWQQRVWEIIQSPIDDRKVHVFIDDRGGAGKSWFCGWLLHHHPNLGIAWSCTGKSADIATVIQENTTILIVDLPRCSTNNSSFPAFIIEKCKDGMIFDGKLKKQANVLLIPPLHVIVFTNNEPDMSVLSEDRWSIEYLSALSPSH